MGRVRGRERGGRGFKERVRGVERGADALEVGAGKGMGLEEVAGGRREGGETGGAIERGRTCRNEKRAMMLLKCQDICILY